MRDECVDADLEQVPVGSIFTQWLADELCYVLK